MAVYKTDVLRERLSQLEVNRESCQGFGYFDEERYDRLSEEISKVRAELEAVENGPDRFALYKD